MGEARLLINLTGEKNYGLVNKTETYYTKLRSAYSDILNDKISNYTYFSFITLCSATLEYSLSFLITEHCFTSYPPELIKVHYESFHRMKFDEKLELLPSICSNDKFVINRENESCKSLKHLISLRNKLIHAKDKPLPFDSINIQPGENNEISVSIAVGPNPIDELTKEMCIEFAEALGKYKSQVLDKCSEKSFEVCEILNKNIFSSQST